MPKNEITGQKNQLVLFGLIAFAYGTVCLVFLFGYLRGISQTVERLIATSGFVIGGFLGLYAMLLSSLSTVQLEPEKVKTLTRFKIVLRLFLFICVIHLLAFLLKYSGAI